ncbi:type II toxin-antitoxin system HicA family toxin [Candidimonas humi]|uniref:Type II toxin-antitoxin system HicA family toxin n=1 Tax=Candidimonas humi TaxID=683355 RepID=A0ABV8NYT7_9BURK|nr:type II toxin-antitoxin system HicA family toxin [Candidimonas humi]
MELIYSRPTTAKLKWPDVLVLFQELGAEIIEREGSRVGIVLFGEIRVMHRPHPTPNLDKAALASIRKWLERNGVAP